MGADKNIVPKAAEFVRNLFNEKLSPKMVYHDLHHTLTTVEAAEEIAKKSGVSDEDTEVLVLAAWFHDTGYTQTYLGHEAGSAAIAEEFLSSQEYSKKKTERVKQLIQATDRKNTPLGQLDEILCDADIISIGKKDFRLRADMLRMEWEVFLEKTYTNEEWAQLQVDFLATTKLYTQYANEEYGQTHDKNLRRARKDLEKLTEKKLKKTDGEKEKKEKEGKLGRGVETMFRSVYRNHIDLSDMADQKANMMISINTIILSIIVTVIGGGISLIGVDFYQHIRFIPPITLLILTCLLSVVFAILSARPMVTSKKITKQKVIDGEVSILYFGNFQKMELPEFHTGITRIMTDMPALYGNMTTDIYYLGKVLTRKYRLLRWSYNVFMVGLVLVVLAFLFTFLFTVRKA